MSQDKNSYDLRGVSASKEEVHKAIKNLDKGLYPNAFCKILPDVVGGDQDFCNVMHADTAGTKTSLAWLYWKETGDLSVWHGIAQDALVMNLDDMACSGFTDDIVISSTIARNKHIVPGEVIESLIQGTQNFISNMHDHGIGIRHAGGETADTGDIVRTIDVGFTAFARMEREKVITNNIRPGAIILGIASDGQSSYESEYNSGIGCNGLTSARHDLLSHIYASKYPETYSPQTPDEFVYTGPFKVTDTLTIQGNQYPVGKLILSPTRTYLPMLVPVIREYRKSLQGLIHCTGGGFSKVLKFLTSPVTLEINAPEVTPEIFRQIKLHTDTPLQEMFKVFNMGVRMLLFVEPKSADKVFDLLSAFGVHIYRLGEVKRSESDQSVVRIHTGSKEEPIVEYK